MYGLLRSILFLFDAEKVHRFSMGMLKLACSIPFKRRMLASWFSPGKGLETAVFGLRFPNPVGLAAGFDKNAAHLRELAVLGFGAIEIGTVTPEPQPGNEKPRLFRLPSDRALINRMGFNNEGVKAAVEALRKWRMTDGGWQAMDGGWKRMDNLPTNNHHRSSTIQQPPTIIGGNIGKNKWTPNEEAWLDYEKCFLALFDYVDYFVVNVSSPNTPGLRELQEKDALGKILSHLQTLNKQKPSPKPILLKIAPDLSQGQLDDIIALAMELKLDGLVATNTTLDRTGLSAASAAQSEKAGAGGLSGAPLRKRSTDIIRYIHEKTGGSIPLIASGGIFTAADAREKLDAGAALVQVWTGFVYEGPGMVKKICKGLTRTQRETR
jgi:dihydroorotate dehydrogenase